ncbi:viroplasmin family protein [uncultured Megasphaera sp.]|uniref:ribonuclease H1 domain-containing protein n=1 Tax=uncultured Megasphaera sp. TaxID=165188 RepID=UPI00265A4926|nr:viroplasmin family protein [uncultured Megasphaera sp.]
MRYYAISAGRKTGIFTTTDEYIRYTSGFKRPKARGFATYTAACTWLKQEQAGHHALPRKKAAVHHLDKSLLKWKERVRLSSQVKQTIYPLDARKVLVIDIELTGLLPTDEILQVSVIDGLGKTRFNRYFKPEHLSSWPQTEEIHHITPESVQCAPPFHAYIPHLSQLFSTAQLIVGYSTMQDISILYHTGVQCPLQPLYVDIGEAYSFVHTRPREPRSYAKLQDCAHHYGYAESDWHNSLADTMATLYCFYAALADPKALFKRMALQ